MPVASSVLTLTLELSRNIHQSRTRERCPSARLTVTTDDGPRDLGALRVDVEKPRFDLPDGAVAQVDADDGISRVIDEAAWLAEIARVLQPGGTVHLTLPASGPLAWYDTRNIYRYATDILSRGDSPDDTLPTGWNRHYSPGDATRILSDAGFTDVRVERVGIGIAEAPQFAGLVVGNFLLGKRDMELRLHPLRRAMERIDHKLPAPFIGTSLSITAVRARVEPDDPADEDASANHPAEEIDSE